MSDLTLELAEDARELVEEEGRLVTLFSINRSPDDPAKPWLGSSSSPHPSKGGAEIPVKVAFVPAGGGDSRLGLGKLLATAEGELRVAYQQVGILASSSIPSPYTPEDVERCDRLRDGDDVWHVVARGHLKPSGNSVLFAFGLTR